MPETSTPDVIDHLAATNTRAAIGQVRAQRSATRAHAQEAYLALFAPAPPVPGAVPVADRLAIATFVAAIHGDAETARFYADQFEAVADRAGRLVVLREAERAATRGPYGRFPAGPLNRESEDGPTFRVNDVARKVIGARLSSALEHAHLLVFHPRDASSAALQALFDAGWSSTDVVILSQVVAFLSFQIRVVAGLRVLADTAPVE